MVGGLLRNEDGCILVSGGDGILWFDPESNAQGVLLDRLDDRPMRGINEMRSDGQGGILFGEVDLPAILRGEQAGPTALYRLDRDRRLTRLVDGLVFTNGLAISADGQRLIHNQSFVGTFAYPLSRDWTLGPPDMLLSKQDCDGMALDAEGHIWITGFGSDQLLRLHGVSGEVMQAIPLPGPAATNIRFGGADLRDIYVTIVSPETATALAQGQLVEAETSMLIKGRSPVAGAPLAQSKFILHAQC